MTRTTRVCALLAATLMLAACGTAGGITTDGAADKPVSLLALSYNVPGRSGGDQLVKLTELAHTLSHGSITLTAGPEPDSGAPDTSADTIAAVAGNKAQLGIVSARTFDTLGVTSFQALQAPYLVTSNQLADKILADPVTDEMLKGTDQLGVVGIGLAFDILAYPGGFGAPVLGPDDYRGHAFQVRPSKANDLLVAALGAVSDPRNGQDLEKAVSAHLVRGNWAYFQEPSQPVGGEVFTANEPAFARANVIIVNKKVWDGLSENQRKELRDAAAQTRDWMASRHTDPAATASTYCSQNGGTIAIATPAQLDAMHQATAPVVTKMEQDPLTAHVIARIRELKKTVAVPATPVACSPAATDTLPIPVLAARGDQHAIDGVWRLDVSEQVLLSAGASQLDAANNAGTWTFAFKGGSFTSTEPKGRTCDGKFALNGSHFLAVVYEPIGCDLVWPFVVSRAGDRLMLKPEKATPTGIPLPDKSGRYSPDGSEFSDAFWSTALVRVGDAP